MVRRRSDLCIGIVVVATVTLMPDLLSTDSASQRQVMTKIGHILVFAAAAWLVWNFTVKSKVVVRSAGLEVVNGYVRHWLPWSAVDFCLFHWGCRN
jgi:hypothetical protein